MRKTIQKISAVIYGIMALYWCWILGYSEIVKLEYATSIGVLSLLVLVAIVSLLATSVMLIVMAFSKKEGVRLPKKTVILATVNIALVEISVIATWEVLYSAAHQTGQQFFVGTPISLVFEIFGSTVGVVIVTALNLFAVKLQNERALFNRPALKEYIFLQKSPYSRVRRTVSVFYSLLALLWAVLLINTAFVKTPRGYETEDIVICVIAAVFFLIAGIFVSANSFSVKVSGLVDLISGILPIISLLPVLLLRANDFDVFYKGAVDMLFGGLADSILIVALTDFGLVNIVVGLVVLFIKLSMAPPTEKENQN